LVGQRTLALQLLDLLLAVGEALALLLQLRIGCCEFGDELVDVGHFFVQHLLIAFEERILLLGLSKFVLKCRNRSFIFLHLFVFNR